jgi:hypothetical protein
MFPKVITSALTAATLLVTLRVYGDGGESGIVALGRRR